MWWGFARGSIHNRNWLKNDLYFAVRDTFCSYGVMELCTRGLGTSTAALKVRNIEAFISIVK